MSGPNRAWHIGDRGPGPGAWSDRGPKPMAHTLGAEPIIERGWVLAASKRQGRDPHDTQTLELPGIDPPLPDCMVARIAAGLYEEADDEVPWLLLLLKAEADSENVLKRGVFA